MRAAYLGPLVVAAVGVGLMFGDVSPAWWITLLVAAGILGFMLLAGV